MGGYYKPYVHMLSSNCEYCERVINLMRFLLTGHDFNCLKMIKISTDIFYCPTYYYYEPK